MAKAAKSDDRHAERLLRQRKAIAAEFNIEDISDWRVRRLALLEATFAGAEDRMAAGMAVDIGPLLQLDSAIQDIRQALKASEGIDFHVTYISRLVCRKCREEMPDEPEPEPLPPPALPAPEPIAAVEKPASAAVKPDKASPQVTHRVGVSASAFHSQVVNGAAAPLKKDQSDIYAIRSISPMSKG